MPQEAKDIEELEALLSGLSESDMAALGELDEEPVVRRAPVTDDDVTDVDVELIEAISEATPTKPKRRPRNLKPLTPVPGAELKEAVSTAAKTPEQLEEEELAALAALEEAASVSAPANSQAKMDAARMEEFAIEVVDLISSLAATFGLEEAKATALLTPIIAEINESSTLAEISEKANKLLTRNAEQAKLADTPFEQEEHKGVGETLMEQAREEVDLLADLPYIDLNEEDPELAKLAEERVKTIDTAKTISLEEMEAKVAEDAELEALLAATSTSPVLATTAPAATSKPIAVTPTKKAGALNTFIDADQLQKDLNFTEASINMAMTRQAALFAHYARLSADATFQADRAKQQVELLEAQLNQRFRDAMVTAGTKFTEKSIDAMVIQDSSYQAAQERAHEAKAIASMVATAADSFRHRKDMLIQVGADLRLEKQGELRTKEHPGQRAVDSLEK